VTMCEIWKWVGGLLILLLASCSSTTGLSKKDPAIPSTPASSPLVDRARAVALRELPPEAELCSCSPSPTRASVCADAEDEGFSVADIFSGRRNPRVPDLAFPVTSGTLSSPFGYRRGIFHSGLDVAACKGEPVLAAADGRVLVTGTRKGYRSYGLTVLIDHGRDVMTHYAHLSRVLVQKGDKVRKGQTIALVGNTGRATSPHLHFEVKVGPQFYNPYVHFAPSQVKNIEVAKGFNLTPMGPVRIRTSSRR
jgi:murein DD-endopeptidase MepM/ murein hydrolase activator NlpD